MRLFPYKDRRSVRVVFDLDPGSETYSELRLTLKVDDQAGERNMALPMDSLTLAPAGRRARAARGPSLGALDAGLRAARHAGAVVHALLSAASAARCVAPAPRQTRRF